MPVSTIPHALQKAEEWLKKDHERVTKLLALKGAQIKYVLHKLGETRVENEEMEKLVPPFHDEDALVQYGMNTYDYFVQTLRPQMEEETNANTHEWMNELENAFLEMRRIVMQSLSKHPALRPYNYLTSLNQKMQEHESRVQTRARTQNEIMRFNRELIQTQAELNEMKEDQAYDTLKRLNETREKLGEEKRVLNDMWLSTWNELSKVFQRLANHEKISGEWENAQHRMVHLYLVNTLVTRDKDPHGKGLVMILQLAVNALEKEKKLFKDMSNEEAREILLNALENPLFVHFPEHYRAIDAAMGQNQHERFRNSAYKKKSSIERALVKSRSSLEKAAQDLVDIEQDIQSSQHQIEKEWTEANHVCKLNLGIELEKIPI